MASPIHSLTENKSVTYGSSDDPCLDFFFQVVPNTPPSSIIDYLNSAWAHNPLTTLKLIFHLRGVRGSGKTDMQAFYTAAIWLYIHHPKTLVANLAITPKFGYYKDLLEIALRALQGEKETNSILASKQARLLAKEKAKINGAWDYSTAEGVTNHWPRRRTTGYWSRKGLSARVAKREGRLEEREVRIQSAKMKDQEKREKASELRKIRRKDMALRVRDRLANDRVFSCLHDAVACVFAEQLIKDKAELDSKFKRKKISLCAEWAPSLDGSYDKRLLICEAVARKIFPKIPSESCGVSDEEYVAAIRIKLHKQYLKPLREALHTPEIYMSANKWGELPYNRVPSVAMKLYTPHFMRHDGVRFEEYLEKVASGKASIASGALLPHLILRAAVNQSTCEARRKVAELQWQRMVTDLRESGEGLRGSLAVCDVSQSMIGLPMDVCIALGLLVSELSDEPWKNMLCTFSQQPQLHAIQGTSLAEKHKFTSNMDWGYNTNFQKVFDNILKLASASNLPHEKMIKRLFVFSDMEFDHASENPWETDYDMITQKFKQAGYEAPPEIAFWNLRDSGSIPVLGTQPGVALLSGFSKNFLKLFLKNGFNYDPSLLLKSAINPLDIMMKSISGKLFDQLKVID